MSDETTLLPCPFCGGEAYTLNQEPKGTGYSVGCHDDECRGFIALSWIYKTEAEAITAWNTRTHGTLTAEQVREAIEERFGFDVWVPKERWKAIADELNAELGSGTKLCYAADENYKRCKYSVNRGWCDDAPFLVWDDTGHLFITMGGLKTWDVTDDVKKWFAELGSGTCEFSPTADNPPTCSNCGWQADVYDCDWLDGGAYEYDGRFCKHCGALVRKAVER